MTKGTLKIHSENILPIIKKWLYSEKDIFLRELVSNACDALQKLRWLKDKGEVSFEEESLRVDVTIHKSSKTIEISDNGLGMEREEIEKYIAQIAFSGAEDFVKKYENESAKDQIIGHFGLGFYSAYMVADKVDIDSLSYKPGAAAAFWSCEGSEEYVMEEGKRSERGTLITLHLSEESAEYLEESRLKEILKKHCAFLPFPIFLNGQKMNGEEPLWMKAPSACKESDYKQFYRYLYPFEEEPLFWMHLNVDYPFHLKGILYFPRLKKQFDFAKHTVKLYCNRVFVADNCKDVIPEYLMVLRGVIDSPDIPLNVSRSYLQSDRTMKQLSSHISKKVSDSLTALFKSDRSKFEACWEDVAPIVKLGIIQDEKFYERVKEVLMWKTVKGEWITLEEYRARHDEKTGSKVLYTFDEKQESLLHALHDKQGIEVLSADFRLDPYLFSQLESKNPGLSFKRVDAELGEHLVDKSKESSVLDSEGKTQGGRLADFYRAQLGEEFEVEAKSLASEELPAFVVIDENERRMRDYMSSLDPAKIPFPTKKKLVLNMNHPLVSKLPLLGDKNLANELAKEIAELTLLGQKEMEPGAMHGFLQRTTKILEKLTESVLKGTS